MACSVVDTNNMRDGEETIRYWLFPYGEDGTPVINQDQLEDLVAKLLAHVAQYTHQYIWNNQSFTLKVRPQAPCDGSSGALGPHIYGVTVVGDFLDDEWFIVFLLVTLTRDFPGLVCRCSILHSQAANFKQEGFVYQPSN